MVSDTMIWTFERDIWRVRNPRATMAFYGAVPNLMELMTGQYLVKMMVAVIDTSVVYGLVWIIHKQWSIDHLIN
ncbi:hypothetical protein [Melghirimyces algeriensis]|uniref:Uncharacterized protein n=1 Tax=Melghirimyces algeriensis TaxID=910412 RepID=A0A521BR23_9BACL|nr:hypothetical protein [Melghirimyces algeriensis]SMO49612.1 hypothetical protein SAMN06264849_102326 [Melghirimyces algeriensis]